MEKKTKIFIGLALVGVAAYMYKDQLGFGTTTTTKAGTSSGGGVATGVQEGIVVIVNNGAWYLIKNGQRYAMQDSAAMAPLGNPATITLSQEEADKIPNSNKEINAQGQIVNRSW